VNFKILEFDEESSFFCSHIRNIHGDERLLPTRALRKCKKEFHGNFINEVLVPIRKQDLPENKDGYELFNKNIEAKLNKKSIEDKLNIITFFGEKSLSINDLVSFKDIDLLATFEQLYNDHLISFPFTLKFRDPSCQSKDILKDIKGSYKDFVSSLKNKKIFGYLPAYVSHREIENFLKIYEDNAITVKSPAGNLNLILLLVDFKGSKPDKFKRTIAALRNLKLDYLSEKCYLFYYGFSIASPRISRKPEEKTKLAKDFLLSFLGFDILGGSHPRTVGGGSPSHTPTKTVGKFKTKDFNYHKTNIPSSLYGINKPDNFTTQNKYLKSLASGVVKDRSLASKELQKRKEANDYLETYT